MSDRKNAPARRLSKDARRTQLLDTAQRIVREEGVDRLTLGHLATAAGVSKPVVYDHFETRSALLIALYRAIDVAKQRELETVLTTGWRSRAETVRILSTTYIHCAVDTGSGWHAVSAALGGSEEKDAVFRELLAGYADLFATVLAPHGALPAAELGRRCIGLVGAGEALATAFVRGDLSEADAARTFASLLEASLLVR